MHEFINMWQLNRLTTKGKYIIFNLVIISSFFINSNSIFSQKYEYIGKDSIEIINSMMSYHLDFLKQNKTFEEITFKRYYNHSFKNIYDSLSNLYIPFKDFYSLEGDIKARNDMSGLSVMLEFLADTNIHYTLCIFIPDSIYHFNQLTKSEFMKKLYKLKKFGIIAFKDTTYFESYDNNEPKPKFSKEYRKMLKKLHKKKMKIENGK